MYLQITTRCNMKCAHCCYSCRPGAGKHMDYQLALDAIHFISDYTEMVSIGGGEPTLHPRFFDILKNALWNFDSVWLASNGSRHKSMERLANIMDDCDYESDGVDDYSVIDAQGKLSVDLSTDSFHDRSMVKDYIWKTWHNRAGQGSPFGLRNVTDSYSGAAAQGRAKRTNVGWSDHCVCDDIIVRVDGSLKLCGCRNSPVIGSVRWGIEGKWKAVMESDEFNNHRCWNRFKKNRGLAFLRRLHESVQVWTGSEATPCPV